MRVTDGVRSDPGYSPYHTAQLNVRGNAKHRDQVVEGVLRGIVTKYPIGYLQIVS